VYQSKSGSDVYFDVDSFAEYGKLSKQQVGEMRHAERTDLGEDKVDPPISYVVNDARRAVQFVRLHAAELNFDPDRLAVAGTSTPTVSVCFPRFTFMVRVGGVAAVSTWVTSPRTIRSCAFW
jgi:hypothetical protein